MDGPGTSPEAPFLVINLSLLKEVRQGHCSHSKISFANWQTDLLGIVGRQEYYYKKFPCRKLNPRSPDAFLLATQLSMLQT